MAKKARCCQTVRLGLPLFWGLTTWDGSGTVELRLIGLPFLGPMA